MENCKIAEEMNGFIDGQRQQLAEISDYIYANPEPGNQEYKACQLLTQLYAAQGFEVETGFLGLNTAFRAVYRHGSGGPNIGLLCEYDALEGLGHACGHNLQPAAVFGAVSALQHYLGDRPAVITVYGTPAEETTSAKIPMAKAGLFDELDVALMMHAGDRTTVDGKSLAVNMVDFVFNGQAAHAAIAPHKGISALDAVLMMFNGIEYLREHFRPDVRVHGIITDGGKAANIVPERAAAQFYIRAADRRYLDQAVERVYNAARGAALTTGAEVTITERKAYDNKINCESLNQLLLKQAAAAGAQNITPPRQFTGSTDFSCVTYRVPGACLRVAFVPQDTPSHSQDWLQAAAGSAAHDAITVAAKALAGTCYELISQPQLLQQIKQDFAAARAEELL